jgi:hypothetical protein
MAEGPLAEVGVGHGHGLLLRRHECVGINVKEVGIGMVHGGKNLVQVHDPRS